MDKGRLDRAIAEINAMQRHRVHTQGEPDAWSFLASIVVELLLYIKDNGPFGGWRVVKWIKLGAFILGLVGRVVDYFTS